MEADALSKDAGHTSTLMGAPETPDISSTTAEPPSPLHSSRSLPSSLPPARPGRPRPPPPTKSSPPPLVSLSNSISASCTEGVQQNTLPPPLFPTLVSSSPLLIPQNIASADPASSSPPLPAPLSSKLLPPSDFTTSSSSPQLLTPSDRLTASSSIWQPKGFSKDQIKNIMEQTTAGTFLIHTREDNSLTLSVRLSEEEGTPLVQNLLIKQHKAYIHLDGSSLVFDDIFKLVSFYCISRDILAIPLRLPQAITTATKKEDLEIIAAMGADFWTSDIHQQETNQDDSKMYLYVNPITLGETSVKDPNQPLISTLHTSTNQNITSLLQNGDSTQNTSLEVKDPKKTVNNQDIKYKRPPPRPPSVGIGSGMGLLFTSSPMPPSTSVGSAAKTKEVVKGNSGEEEERKSTSPAPLRPPVPLHSRGAPPLPPAPLCRISSRKSSNQDAGDGREREKGQNPAKKTEGTIGDEMGDHKAGCKSGLLGDGGNMENSQEEEMKKEKGKGGNEKKEKETILEKYGKEKSSSQCPTSVKRPSRPVPPPRRKPCDSPVCTNQPAPPNQGPGMRMPAPSPPRRPDVSLYSPQGGTVIGTDPDSCSSSSTEEEGDASQEQEQQNHLADSRSTKVTVKRAPTTVMLDRARHRLSTVLTGLISHDRRLTQRIVELARDPLSYFGNLVKEHRAFTLESMSNHLTSTELLQEIRQMITQLKSYLLQSTELQSMLEPQHQYTQDKLENIIEAALCKSVLKPLREPIYHSLKKLRTDDGSLKQLTEHQSIVLGSTTTALGITTAVPEASAMEKISIKLNKLHLDYSPQKKIELLLKACKIIYDSMSVSGPGRAHGADDFLPVMMYVLARSNLSNLQLDVEYMMELMDPSLALGEGSYYLTTTYGAVEHFKSFDQHRSTTRQLSREVQDSIHRWERRRTLNQERVTQASVRDFLTVCCPEMGSNPKTLGVLPSTMVHELAEQCAARFEQDSYILSVFMDGDHRPLEPTELAVSVKNSCQPGTYCFVYHPRDQPNNQQDQPNNQRDRPNNQQDQPNNQQDRPNNQQDQPNNQQDQPNNQQDQPNNQQDQPNNQQDQPNNQQDQPNNQQDQPNNQRDRPNNQRDQPNNQRDRPISQRSRSCPTDPPPAPPVQRFFPAKVAVVDNAEVEAEEESLITL